MMYTYTDGPVIKGSRDGLVIVFDGRMEKEFVLESLDRRIRSAADFFRDASASVRIMHEQWDSEKIKPVKELLAHWNISVDAIDSGCSDEELSSTSESQNRTMETWEKLQEDIEGLLLNETPPVVISVPPEKEDKQTVSNDQSEKGTSLIRRTLRSGQHVSFDGNVVVIGDVNPGAEITASGDILVFGSFRGVAHAGASGNEDAVVAALRLLPTQLRIANYISRAPDERTMQPRRPEIARIRAGHIEIEHFLI